ncbi:hypothetical protein ACFQU7_20920 [Pseudoroseomonas wenyumeiae]
MSGWWTARTPLPLTPARAGELPDEATLEALTAHPDGAAIETQARNGQEFAYAATALDTDVRLVVGLPTGGLRRTANELLLRRVAELAAFLLACLVVIVVGADIAIARPLRVLAGRVREWRPGAPSAASRCVGSRRRSAGWNRPSPMPPSPSRRGRRSCAPPCASATC